MNVRIIPIIGAVLFAGCLPEPQTQQIELQHRPVAVETGSRIEVTLLSQFTDRLAYSNSRGVYLIVDHDTGAEYIGVSGIGITEVGSHHCGKSCSAEDER